MREMGAASKGCDGHSGRWFRRPVLGRRRPAVPRCAPAPRACPRALPHRHPLGATSKRSRGAAVWKRRVLKRTPSGNAVY
jgi:hypothetical protein